MPDLKETHGLLAMLERQALVREPEGTAIVDEVRRRVQAAVRELASINEYVEEHEEGDVPILWRIRSLLTPEEDTSAVDQYTFQMRGVGVAEQPPYERWYATHIVPSPPEPTPKERFEGALAQLDAAHPVGYGDIRAGLVVAWRGAGSETQCAQVARLAELVVKGAQS
jgi:hypothetical protein